VAPFFFFVGILLGGLFGTRIFIRVYKLMHEWGLTYTWDPFSDSIARVTLRGNLVLDAFGLLVAVVITIAAILFLRV
jgi:hypothetical protein